MTMTLTILLCVVIFLAEENAASPPKNLDVTSPTQTPSDDRLDQLELMVIGQQKMISGLQLELNEQLTSLTANITRLRACTAPRVAFTATFKSTGSISMGSPGVTVKYDKIIENAGDYDVNTGTFTCAEPGVYSFTVRAMTDSGIHACLALLHNNTVVTTLQAEDKDNGSASMGATITLGLGDTVYVWACMLRVGESSLYQWNQANIFMGHLVHGDACL